MKSRGEDRSRTLSLLYRSLLICVAFVGVVFIGGTIYGLFLRTPPSSNIRNDNSPVEAGQIFTGIGRLRAETSDPQPGTVILFVTFMYDPSDKAFSEELALRVRDFRGVIVDYIHSVTRKELQTMGEDKIKTELLRRINLILRLGQIKSMYFSDFMIIG